MTKAIRNKSGALEMPQHLTAAFENITSKKVRALKTDHGGEYRSKDCLVWLANKGITLRPTVPYHGETNAVAERFDRAFKTMMRANVDVMPKYLWR